MKNLRFYKDIELVKEFGLFTWKDSKTHKGMIEIDPKWVADNIVSEKVAGYLLQCHRLVFPILKEFLLTAKEKGWIKDYGGCWVPRHKTWNLKRGLSRHSWGVAIDVNVKDNPYGLRVSNQPDEMTEWLRNHNFKQLIPGDPMHYEIAVEEKP